MHADWKKLRAVLRAKPPVHTGENTQTEIDRRDDGLDDVSFFRAAVADVRPLSPLSVRGRIHHEPPAPPQPVPRQFLADERNALHESRFGVMALQDRLEGGDEPMYLRSGLPQQVLKDLRRGRWTIQREIDLHGCNREEARQHLAEFLLQCLKQGVRSIRIIHGKGLRSPGRQGLLRVLVRGWLAQRQEVLAYCQASPQDGGEGALLALLRAPHSDP